MKANFIKKKDTFLYNLGIKTENFKQICKNNCVARKNFSKRIRFAACLLESSEY